MALLQNSIVPAAAASEEEVVDRSLRLEWGTSTANGPNLYQFGTPNSGSDNKVCTIAFWVKRSYLGRGDRFVSLGGSQTGGGSQSEFEIRFTTADQLQIINSVNNSSAWSLITAAKFRDTSAWMAVCIAIDTDAASGSRVKVWVNNSLYSLSGTEPSSGYTGNRFGTGYWNRIGAGVDGGNPYFGFNGYLADFHRIDGQVKAPTDFIQINPNVRGWRPKAYTGSYGTNGFHLKFADSTNIGEDSSGNANHFSTSGITSSNISPDVPARSYAQLSASAGASGAVINSPTKGTVYNYTQTIIASPPIKNDEIYWEVRAGNNQDMIGAVSSSHVGSMNTYAGAYTYGWSYYASNGYIYTGGNYYGFGAAYSSGDILGFLFNAGSGRVRIWKNGSIQSTRTVSTTSTMRWHPCLGFGAVAAYGPSTQYINFGQDPSFSGTESRTPDTVEFQYYPSSQFP